MESIFIQAVGGTEPKANPFAERTLADHLRKLTRRCP
ncbi:hypothetical protein CBM2633_B40147 [Cupriavidus taiwanensis]|nr:hypothetical protein CBM2633_B40147 [Cupriavidus taiwanensis]